MPTRDELYLAYRQAKVALFFERRGVGLVELARFERNLGRRLDELASRLADNGGWFDGLPEGEVWVVPKKLRLNVDDNIGYIGGKPSNNTIRGLDVQIRYTPSPECAIVEVLFLWQFGPILESLLSKSALGYRLELQSGRISKTRRWLFEYWPKRYEEFRTIPIDVATQEISKGHSVVLLCADLTSFYDTVDPSFLLNDDFVGELEESVSSSLENSNLRISQYRSAAASLLRFYRRFQHRAARRTGLSWTTGIPIGALTSRLVANLALSNLDQSIEKRPNTRCYKRYVDDLAILARVEGDQSRDVDQVILDHIPHLHTENSTFRIDESAIKRPGSEFRIQRAKCKAYYLSDVSGSDFLASVRRDFGRLVSGSRAFLDPTIFHENGQQSLLHVGPPGRPLTVLREADRTRLEHFELATRLRSLERATILAERDSASGLVKRALDETIRFLSSEVDWVENLDVALRMLRLGIRARDWEHTDDLYSYMDDIWIDVEKLRGAAGRLFHRDREITLSNSWVWLRNYLHTMRIEAICSVLSPHYPDSPPRWLRSGVLNRTRTIQWSTLLARARLLAAADLRAFDREDDAFDDASNNVRLQNDGFGNYDAELRQRFSLVNEFVEICRRLDDRPWIMSPVRLFLSTRPPSYFDVARRVLYRTEAGLRSEVFTELLEMVNAIRGTQYSDPVGEVIDDYTVHIPGRLELGDDDFANPQLILGNLVLSEEFFTRAATRKSASNTGDPVLTVERLRDLTEILAKSYELAQRHQPSPSLLVLPELSLPRAWFREVATHVSKYGSFGLIVGLEYLHRPSDRLVFNQVYAVIPGPFKSTATWPWTKEFPAREEFTKLNELNVSFEKRDNRESRPRTVVESQYGSISVLICSELIEAYRISDLAGRVEVVAVPAWNKDTSSYDHLIQTAGLQLNAIIGVANNGHYSDCRAWAPKRTRWERDLCRLVERDTNAVIAVTLPLESLREWRYSAHSGGLSDESEWRPLPPDWRLLY